jgi:hypothetical protein
MPRGVVELDLARAGRYEDELALRRAMRAVPSSPAKIRVTIMRSIGTHSISWPRRSS